VQICTRPMGPRWFLLNTSVTKMCILQSIISPYRCVLSNRRVFKATEVMCTCAMSTPDRSSICWMQIAMTTDRWCHLLYCGRLIFATISPFKFRVCCHHSVLGGHPGGDVFRTSGRGHLQDISTGTSSGHLDGDIFRTSG